MFRGTPKSVSGGGSDIEVMVFFVVRFVCFCWLFPVVVAAAFTAVVSVRVVDAFEATAVPDESFVTTAAVDALVDVFKFVILSVGSYRRPRGVVPIVFSKACSINTTVCRVKRQPAEKPTM